MEAYVHNVVLTWEVSSVLVSRYVGLEGFYTTVALRGHSTEVSEVRHAGDVDPRSLRPVLISTDLPIRRQQRGLHFKTVTTSQDQRKSEIPSVCA